MEQCTQRVVIDIPFNHMALRIANPAVVDKIERLASLTGLDKTAAVEIAVDFLLMEAEKSSAQERRAGRIRREHAHHTLTIRLPIASSSTRSPGSITVVQSSCSTIAGPSKRAPAGRCSRT